MPPAHKPLPAQPPPKPKPPPAPPKPAQAPPRPAQAPERKAPPAPKPPAPKPPAPKPTPKPAGRAPTPKPAPKPPASKPSQPARHAPSKPPAHKKGAPVAGAARPVAVTASYDSDQVRNQKTVVSLCESNHVPLLGSIAALCAGRGENNWHTDGCNRSNHCGFWQLDADWQRQHDYHDVVYWTRYAIQHGFYGHGGLSKIAKDNPSLPAGMVAQLCQGAGPSDAAAAAYYQQFVGEANDIWNRYKSGETPAPVKQERLYANPLEQAHVTASRIDQGVDYAGTGYYVAFADCVITAATNDTSGWTRDHPGGYVEYRITADVPMKDDYFYCAEGITTHHSVGDHVKVGDTLCSLRPNWPTATEIGQAAGDGSESTWAAKFGGGYNEGDLTRAGIAFSRLVQQLGGIGGLVEGRTPVGEWPRWANGGEVNKVIDAGLVGAIPGVSQAVHLPSPKRGAGTYNWPQQDLDAWTALDHAAKAAQDVSNSLREYVSPIQHLTKKGV